MMRVLRGGVPRAIQTGLFPDSFQVNSTWYKFIVLSPQVETNQGFDDITRSSTVPPAAIDALIDFAKNNYRIDTSKIYLAGLSMGGGTTWNYAGSSRQTADRLAAIIVAAGAYDLSSAEAANIAVSDLPVIATHNNDDDVIAANRTVDNISRIVASGAQMTRQPRAVYWSDGGHNVWRRTFEQLTPGSGNLVDTLGITAYNWALQFSATASGLPVVWKDFSALSTGKAVQLKWTIASQVNVEKYFVQRSTDGRNFSSIAQVAPIRDNGSLLVYQYTDNHPPAGEVFYRIYQTDLDGKSSYSSIKNVRVNQTIAAMQAFPNPFGSQLTIDLKDITESVEVKLQDAQGRTLRTSRIEAGNSARSNIVLSGLNGLGGGMYYVVVTTTGGKLITQVPVMKQ
jgi:predicted esterase